MTSNTLSHQDSLDTLLALLPSDPNARGKEFEKVAQWFLKEDPEYSHKFRQVWRWSEWPKRWGGDIGIDLVAETRDGKLWAIQVKGYDPENQVPTKEIDSFISASARPEFSHRLLISTGSISRNAEYKLNKQEKSTSFLLYEQLSKRPVIWRAYFDQTVAALPDKKTPRPYQQKAIEDVIEGFDQRDRGRLIMACGTGKTLVGLWVSERLDSVRTLVLVPSLALIEQISLEWMFNAGESFQALYVCSDQTVARDEFISHTSQLGLVTTDPEDIQAFMSGAGRRVIFCTYQSSPSIKAAQESGAPRFDMIIADEAHHCAGKVDSSFATVLGTDTIKSTHRLFMTATPRYLSGRIKNAAAQADIQITSMDDPSVFGPEFHSLSFGQAIDQGYLSDYQVVIIGVTDQEVNQLAQNRTLVELFGAAPATDAESLAAMLGTLKAIRKYDLHHVITFHNRVSRARDFSMRVKQLNNVLPSDESLTTLWVDHVSGEMPTGERTPILQQFKMLTEGTHLLSNARCLGEGVDIREIDGIGFIDPRRSKIDIVQAVGRAIRKSDSNKIGSVVIPILIDDEAVADADEQLSRSRFGPIWDVLNALRAHDDGLGREIDQLRFQIGKHGRIVGSLPDKLVIDIPTSVGKEFVDALKVRLVETTTSSWEFWFGLLSAYMEKEVRAASGVNSRTTLTPQPTPRSMHSFQAHQSHQRTPKRFHRRR